MDRLNPSARLRLDNLVAVVTGGARGIGEGIVRRFAQEGARVVFSDLLNEKGRGLEEELGKDVAFHQADATSASDTEALMNFAVERFGRLDCVVNNAGAGGEGGPITETSSRLQGVFHGQYGHQFPSTRRAPRYNSGWVLLSGHSLQCEVVDAEHRNSKR
jgi:NAD(P)-dependent dehydrogenase (short-subunit alcohol dehydrogenase family)